MKFLGYFFSLFCVLAHSQELSQQDKTAIQKQLENLRTAHLNSDSVLVKSIYDTDLVLTSQSGTRYDFDTAVKNLQHKFESYQSSDFYFLPLDANVVLTNYINERKYEGFDKGKFRLTVIWRKHEDNWKIVSMQSSRIKKRK